MSDFSRFEDALKYAKELHENVNIMVDKHGGFHIIREFAIEHWSKHYKTITEVRMVHQITGRTS